jgi:hypothetical protein
MTDFRVWIGAVVAVAIWLFSNAYYDAHTTIPTRCAATRCT